MNKLLSAMCITAFSCLGEAQAQVSASNISIYAVIDAGVSRDTGRFSAGTVVQQVSGGETASRLGFSGKEDLGGGLSAIFNLETGYNLDDGSLSQGASLLFGRKAWVGLQGDFGTLKLGRQDSSVYTSGIMNDPMVDGLGGGFTRIFTNSATFRRNDNTIDYATPVVRGLSAELAYSMGEVAGDMQAGRGYFGSVAYAGGPFRVSLAHQNINSKPLTTEPIVTTRLTVLGGSYDFTAIKLYGLYQLNKANSAVTLDSRDMLLGASVPINAKNTVMMSYMQHQDRVTANADARQLALAYTYALSKRTDIYAGASRITNQGKARFGLASLTAGGSASGTTDTLLTTGVRHVF